MKSILITGGSGFLGNGLVSELLRRDSFERVCVFSRDEYKQSLMRQKFNSDRHLRWFIGDVRDLDRLIRALDGVDVVIHAAALKRVETGEYDGAELCKTNIIGTMNVIRAAEIAGVNKVIAVSTDKAVSPINGYGASKLLMEKLILGANSSRGSEGPLFSVVRYGNVAGSTGSVIPTWRKLHEQGWPVRLTDPGATRFWMARDEAVALVLQAVEEAQGGELIIPELPAYRLGDLAEAMGVLFMASGLAQGEKMHEALDAGVTSDRARRMGIDELREALKTI